MELWFWFIMWITILRFTPKSIAIHRKQTPVCLYDYPFNFDCTLPVTLIRLVTSFKTMFAIVYELASFKTIIYFVFKFTSFKALYYILEAWWLLSSPMSAYISHSLVCHLSSVSQQACSVSKCVDGSRG